MFKQDFAADLDAATAGLMPGYAGPPYALVRHGDGEAAIIAGRFYQTKADGWRWPGGKCEPTGLRSALLDALMYSGDGWHVGLPCPRHEPQLFRELRPLVCVPRERLTFAKIFSDGNYSRFRMRLAAAMELGTQPFCVGSRHQAKYRFDVDFEVPGDWMQEIAKGAEWLSLVETVVDVLQVIRRPILVAAGPLAKVIIHRYWVTTPPENRQVIIDAGSAIDELVKDRRYRVKAYDRSAKHVWTDEDEAAAVPF